MICTKLQWDAANGLAGCVVQHAGGLAAYLPCLGVSLVFCGAWGLVLSSTDKALR